MPSCGPPGDPGQPRGCNSAKPFVLKKKNLKIKKSGLTCLKSPFLMDSCTFGGICSKLLWVVACPWSGPRSHVWDSQGSRLGCDAWGAFSSQFMLNQEKSHPKADSGGFPSPWNFFFLTRCACEITTLLSWKLVLKKLSSAHDKIILTFRKDSFPGKELQPFFSPQRWNLHPCF